jgi:hypothetical protein
MSKRDVTNAIDEFFKEDEKPSPVTGEASNLHTYVPTNVATEEQTNKRMNEEVDEGTNMPTNNRLRMYLDIYTLKATKEEIKRGRYKPTNVEISDELRLAMDKLIAIYTDGVVPNDTDKTYKEIIDNALYEYLAKRYKQLLQDAK